MIGKCLFKSFHVFLMNFEKYGYVLAAPTRISIVKALISEKTPLQLTKELKKSDSNISRALTELTKNGIIKCLNPNSKKGKLYALTDDGKEIFKRVIN